MIGKSFHSLPKDLRELIWDEFEGKELYRKRAVCKKWQEGLDNARRTSLKKKMESCEKERRIHDQFFLVMPTEERSYKILLLGNAAVGKTSLLWRYTENFFQDFYIYTVYSYYFIPPQLLPLLFLFHSQPSQPSPLPLFKQKQEGEKEGGRRAGSGSDKVEWRWSETSPVGFKERREEGEKGGEDGDGKVRERLFTHPSLAS